MVKSLTRSTPSKPSRMLLWRETAVHRARRLGRGERAAELLGDRHDRVVGERSTGSKQRVEREPFDVIHRDEGNAGVIAHLAQPDHVAMHESARATSPRAARPRARRRRLGERGRAISLERDGGAGHAIACTIGHAQLLARQAPRRCDSGRRSRRPAWAPRRCIRCVAPPAARHRRRSRVTRHPARGRMDSTCAAATAEATAPTARAGRKGSAALTAAESAAAIAHVVGERLHCLVEHRTSSCGASIGHRMARSSTSPPSAARAPPWRAREWTARRARSTARAASAKSAMPQQRREQQRAPNLGDVRARRVARAHHDEPTDDRRRPPW